MLAYVNQGTETQTVLAKDSASTTYGTMDGFSLCGPRSYSISPTTHSFLSLLGDTLTLQSTDPSEATASPITITIESNLDDYPAVPAAVETFVIEIIDLCETATIAQTDQTPSKPYTYTGPTSFQASFTVSDSDCQIEYSCEPIASSGFDVCQIVEIDQSLGSFTVDATESISAISPATYDLRIKGAISGYP